MVFGLPRAALPQYLITFWFFCGTFSQRLAVPDSIANLATDKGSIILAVAEPANALLTHDPIRLMALFRSQPKSLLLSTPEVLHA